MRVRFVEDVRDFAEAVAPFLRSEPFSANVLASHVDGILRGSRAMLPGSLWILVERDGAVAEAAMETPPWPLFLPRLGDGVPEAIAAVLADAGRPLAGVNGEVSSVDRFARAWSARSGASSRTRVSTRLYVLDRLRPPERVRGSARLAAFEDVGLVASWFGAFRDEAAPESPDLDPTELARSQVQSGEIWLWEAAGEPVALAGVRPPVEGVARIGPVYTPPAQRRQGYGAAVTAAATQAAIDAGSADVVLYTDLANPISNSIYRAIGYVPDHDAEEREFLG
jgi:predicted GNAT family acetyltransferase